MKTTLKSALGALAIATVFGLGGCAGMSRQDQNTAVGAGVNGTLQVSDPLMYGVRAGFKF